MMFQMKGSQYALRGWWSCMQCTSCGQLKIEVSVSVDTRYILKEGCRWRRGGGHDSQVPDKGKSGDQERSRAAKHR